KGQIVGEYTDSNGVHGFLYSDGVYTTIDDPLGNYTVAFGINNKGQIVGYYNDSSGAHGFDLTLLGQYSTGNFSLASDGHGGTVVTDPLVGSAGHAALFGAQT